MSHYEKSREFDASSGADEEYRERFYGHPFRLLNVGRERFCGEVTASNPDDLLNAVSRHLMSRTVSISSTGRVIVGGFRVVGNVEPIGDVAAAKFKTWFDEID